MSSLFLALISVVRRIFGPVVALWLFVCPAIAQTPVNSSPHNDARNLVLAGFPRPLAEADQPLREKLRSPRDTLQTLYYAVDVYDFFPNIIQDAVACLDLGDSMPTDSASAALIAVHLECVLNSLDLPLAGVTDKTTGDVVTIADADDIKIIMRKYTDGMWRFDRGTVERTPAMRRTVLARQKNLMVERAALREGFTDPRTTIKRFWLDALAGDFTAAARAMDLS